MSEYYRLRLDYTNVKYVAIRNFMVNSFVILKCGIELGRFLAGGMLLINHVGVTLKLSF
jgi:hypothetical protein